CRKKTELTNSPTSRPALQLASPQKIGAFIVAFGQNAEGEIYVLTKRAEHDHRQHWKSLQTDADVVPSKDHLAWRFMECWDPLHSTLTPRNRSEWPALAIRRSG